MSVLDQIASRQGRRDDKPNKDLAKQLADEGNKSGIREIAENLSSNELAVQSDCIKVLYEVGYLNPSLIAEYLQAFLIFIKSKVNRLVWGGMTALSTIASHKADELFPHIEYIKHAVTEGSVITRDSGITTLAGIGSVCEDYRKGVLPFLLDILIICRPKEVPSYAEKILPIVDKLNCDPFVQALEERMLSLSERQTRCVQKVIMTAEKMNQAG